jgi:excisionase family DNA binding protein
MNSINQFTKNDSIRLIDLVRRDMKELVSEVIREELESFKNCLNNPPLVKIEYVTRGQAANQLHVTLPTLREWTKTGRIKSYKIARRVLYKPEDIDNALREQPRFVRK